MSWSDSGNVLSASGTGNELADCSGDGVPTSGTPSVQTLESEHKCYFIDEYRISLGAGAEWTEKNSIVCLKQDSDGNALAFGSATSAFNFGSGDLSTALKPITYNGCFFYWDHQEGSTDILYDNFMAANSNGIFRFYGGIIAVHPMAGGTVDGLNGGFMYLPNDEVRVVNVNWDRFGGCRFYGSSFRVQEVRAQGSNGYGFSSLSSADTVGINGLNMQANNGGLYLSSVQPDDSTYINVAFRDVSHEIVLALFGSGAGNYAEIINSDAVRSIGKLTLWAEWDGTASIEEKTSYDIKCINESGANITGVNCRVVRTLSGTGYSSVTWAKSTGTGDLIVPNELLLDTTDSSGEVDQLLLVRRYYNNSTYPGTSTGTAPLNFSGFYVTIRKYGYVFEDIALAPQFGQNKGLAQTYILKEDVAVEEATQATVDAYTGITISEAGESITLTSAHTVNEVYDFVHSWLTKDAQMNFETDYDTDGIPGTSQITPFKSTDGIVYTVLNTWSFVGDSYLTLDGKVFEYPNGNRIIPISLTDVEEGSTYVIKDSSDTTLYSGIIDDTGEFYTERLWTQTNIDVTITVRLQGYVFFEATAQITGGGLVVQVNSTEDKMYQFPKGRIQQTGYRFRNDNGSETTATWKAAENTDITGVAKSTNLRLRTQIEEIRNKEQEAHLILQYRKAGDKIWIDVEQ